MSVVLENEMTKQELRAEIRRRKKTYTTEELDAFSYEVCSQVMSLSVWKEASVILLYASLPDEVNTDLLIQNAILNGKTILLPVVKGDNLVLRSFSGETKEGAFGIQEPVGEDWADFENIQLAIIPGVAFDTMGNRLGRGKGYYDRLLPFLTAEKIGICFLFQRVETVPVNSHDCQMDRVIP